MVGDWADSAACQWSDPEAFFSEEAEQDLAKRVCRKCPVRRECLASALDLRTDFGVWGGLTVRERRSLRRRHPHVASWQRLLADRALDEDVQYAF